jgi:hypothetical protein
LARQPKIFDGISRIVFWGVFYDIIPLKEKIMIRLRKLRLYLDTSVISNIDAPHAPDKEAVTKEFFRIVTEQFDEYELFISPMGLVEIEESPESKRLRFINFLKQLSYTQLQESQNAKDLARLYIEQGVLGERHIKDLTHIAYAVLARCDYIISWNFKHFVNVRTISRVNAVNRSNKYAEVIIASPIIITGELPNEND